MAYYSDLSPYDYYDFDVAMVNVGWLDALHTFETGAVSTEFVDALILCAVDSEQQMRGYHHCEFCEEESPISVKRPDGSRYVRLGSAEIHAVAEDGQRYSAPNLVVHYVLAHNYRPPAEFRAAVIHDNATRSRPAYTCPVCGYPELREPATDSDAISGQRCPSCGVRFNMDLPGTSAEELRKVWVEAGRPWSSPWEPEALDWDPITQLKTVDRG